MMKRWLSCPMCTVLGLLGLGLLALLLMGRGDAKASSVRATSEADGSTLLAAGGFPWARLQIDNEVGRIIGEAPDPAARQAAFAAAATTLPAMMGLPGVFARLEDGQTVLAVAAAAPPAPTVEAAAPAPALSAVACEQAMAQVVEAQQIRFQTASAILMPSSAGAITQLHDALARCAQATVSVEGHTDAVGDEASNQRLSERRAAAVVKALVAAGVPAERLVSRGFGESKPLDAAETTAAYERNRRIEFHLVQ